MKVLITGAHGMLGQALVRRLEGQHVIRETDLHNLDVTSLEEVRAACADWKPECVIHAAAYTQVDGAEKAPEEAFRVNALGTRNVAAAAQESDALLVYYSTDYVFDGTAEAPYREWDSPSPLSVYGSSKYAGEVFARQLCPRHQVIRTSWLFGPGGPNFVETILRLAGERSQISVVDDQRGSPTYTPDLAEMTARLIERKATGTYHVTNSGDCSWFEFAREILRAAGRQTGVEPITSSQFNAPAPRPSYSVLENFLLRLERITLLRPWQEALADYLERRDG